MALYAQKSLETVTIQKFTVQIKCCAFVLNFLTFNVHQDVHFEFEISTDINGVFRAAPSNVKQVN